MEIFQKYKTVGINNNVDTVSKFRGLPLVVVGPRNVGKKTIIRKAFPDVKFTDTVSTITERVNGYFYNSVCVTNIEKLKQSELDKLACYIEKFSEYMSIICTSKTHNIYPKILGRCVKLYIRLPQSEEIDKHIIPIITEENLRIDVSTLYNKTYHNILLELTLVKNNKNPNLLYDYDEFIDNLCKSLHKIDFTEVRTRIYKLFLAQVSMSYTIKKSSEILCSMYKLHINYIVSSAANFEARICNGNKDVYHAEAFLFSIKKRI